jgi:micrococcal nuclease
MFMADNKMVFRKRRPIFQTERLFSFLAVLSFAAALSGQAERKTIAASEAADHIGEHQTVCGAVASTRYASSSRGQPTFLNLEKPYPDQIFTVIIWGRNREKFGRPEVQFKDKDICVSGTIESYRGVPQIEAREPSQIETK